MIITRLIGGLGNQMFQYAAGRRLAHSLDTDLKIDTSDFTSSKTRNYALDCFNIQTTLSTPFDLKRVAKGNVSRLEKIKRLIDHNWQQNCISYNKEKHFHFDPDILSLSNDSYLDGYWQSEKYFLDIGDIIRKEFTISNTPSTANQTIAANIQHHHSVAIHIRRGDYITDSVSSQLHDTYNIEYYKKAIEIILEKVSEAHFYVFSDDPDWVKNNFILDNPTTYVSHNNDSCHEDMKLISLCKHQIIANSSFSWWGAWLNKNPDKIVIAPTHWFRVNDYNTSDLIPASWIRSE